LAKESMQTDIRIGPAGWSYPDWDGVVYPPPARGAHIDRLDYLASYFTLIEINSTFYRVPTASMCRSWADRTPPSPAFRFSVKAYRDFTHSRGADALDAAPSFTRALFPLRDDDKLACVLVQFPWSFRCDDGARRRIDAIAAALMPLPIALEVRHSSWMSEHGRRYLEATGHTVCGIDQPVIGDSIPPFVHTTGAAGSYFRFHGRNYADWFRDGAGRDARYDYLYSPDELRSWLGTIRDAASRGPVSAVMNNHFRGQALANAFELMEMLTGTPPRAPRALRRAYQRLESVTTPEGEDDAAAPSLFD
jgi:uncharacterized protein YecE (DUF72 family)